MQMWYNDSMISSSKRREKGYRFDSLKPTCGLHLLFTTDSPAISELRTFTHIIDAMDCQRKRI